MGSNPAIYPIPFPSYRSFSSVFQKLVPYLTPHHHPLFSRPYFPSLQYLTASTVSHSSSFNTDKAKKKKKKTVLQDIVKNRKQKVYCKQYSDRELVWLPVDEKYLTTRYRPRHAAKRFSRNSVSSPCQAAGEFYDRVSHLDTLGQSVRRVCIELGINTLQHLS